MARPHMHLLRPSTHVVATIRSAFNQVIEQPWLQRLQRRLLCFEEVRLGLATLLALTRVAVIGILRDGNILAAAAQFLGERVRIKSCALIINLVLQVIGIATLLR